MLQLKVTVLQCSNLPVMDTFSKSCDSYVKLWAIHYNDSHLYPNTDTWQEPSDSSLVKKTKVVKKNLNPVFENESFVFDFPNFDLASDSSSVNLDPMDSLLMIKVMDYDRITRDEEIGFVLLQFFGMNLKLGERLQQTFELVGAKSGTIELAIEAIQSVSSNSQNRQDYTSPPPYPISTPITELFGPTFLTVGPVLGVVKSTSARVLIECSKATTLQVECIEIESRSHIGVKKEYLDTMECISHSENTLGKSYKELMCKSLMGRLLKSTTGGSLSSSDFVNEKNIVLKMVHVPKSNVPFVFTLDGLKPDHVYMIRFTNIFNRDHRIGIIKTMADDSLVVSSLQKKVALPHFLNVACLSCNFIERRNPEKDMWQRMKICKGRNQVSPQEEEAIKENFRKYYRLNWNHPATRRFISQVSNLMILDDHEIRDDWGSNEADKRKDTPEYYVGSLARQVYWEYQRALREDIDDRVRMSNKHEAYYHIIGDVGILVLDLRAARSFLSSNAGDKIFLGEDQWNDLNSWLFGTQQGSSPLSTPQIKSLIVVCSVPLIFLNKKLTEALPKMRSDLDDFRDHWTFGKQYPEQIDLLEMIRKWISSHPNRNCVVLGGDVHIGGSTTIKKDGKIVCEQLTSSAVCNIEMSFTENAVLKFMIKVSETLREGWTFKHHQWTKDNNYGIVHIATTEKDEKPSIHAYLNTFDKSYIYQ
ncbi:hypothetical protein C9374_005329 [Naegleria lovaniensis]|uniref:C2 domain-containing protein n=1 Tax=Naegleria lovaniensis TaxID=51637 RepID=A0AA88GPC2_NAELO|nr:uncharacterized protein C9374_005329 [Naegleria lovaniensis]KAG2382749.1 hypothetical protein C9374_005329 [Naegleria lovaniensis]